MVLVAAGAAGAALIWGYLPRRRYRRYMARPFPDDWNDALSRVPLCDGLPEALRAELRDKIKAFLYHKRFVGCEGLEVDDDMRVQVAALACLLVLNRPSTLYRPVQWVYLFPGAFRSRRPERDEFGVVSTPEGDLLGHSWSNGRVVLAWDSVRKGIARPDDGFNVVLHEFAHQLDQEDGSADGAPLLYERRDYADWSDVLSEEYEQLHRDLESGRHTLIDPYGATNPAEFFAVVTELFYECPHDLADRHPRLFRAFMDYYRVDPREWRDKPCRGRWP
nr:M90 family metallopeptidase [Parahaliea mediterranea]